MKISVITICKNSQDTIEQTIQSVVNQKFDDYEYIVIDGKSTDRTLEIIEKYKDKINKLISEKDTGIYDAMNKGIEIASGDYIIFLNSDDVFFNENVLNLAAQQADIEKYDLLYGDLIFLNKKNGNCTVSKQDNVNFVYLCARTIFHPTIFASKKLFNKIGNFDVNYKIAADYDWVLRALLEYKASSKYLGFVTTIFTDCTGISTDPKYKTQQKSERVDVQNKYYKKNRCAIYNFFYRSMRSILNIPLIKYILKKQFQESTNKNHR